TPPQRQTSSQCGRAQPHTGPRWLTARVTQALHPTSPMIGGQARPSASQVARSEPAVRPTRPKPDIPRRAFHGEAALAEPQPMATGVRTTDEEDAICQPAQFGAMPVVPSDFWNVRAVLC